MGKEAHLVCADHAHPCGDEGICLEHCHQLGILPFYVPHELLRMRKHMEGETQFYTHTAYLRRSLTVTLGLTADTLKLDNARGCDN